MEFITVKERDVHVPAFKRTQLLPPRNLHNGASTSHLPDQTYQIDLVQF